MTVLLAMNLSGFLLSLASPTELKSMGTDLVIGGLIVEALVIVLLKSGKIEKATLVACALVIAGGVWLEHIGDAAIAAPRSLSEEQQKHVAAKISTFKGQQVILGVIPPIFEQSSLAGQIANALALAGTDPQFNQSVAESTVGPVRGVVARYVTGNRRGQNFAQAFAAALREEGIVASAEPGLAVIMPKPEELQEKAASWVGVVVGEKP